MSDFIHQLVQSVIEGMRNQVFAGGLALGIVAAVGALLRKVPGRIFRWLQSRIIVEFDVQSTDQAYEWITVWLDALPYAKRARRLSLTARWYGEEQAALFTPAPGIHYFFYKGRLVTMDRERKDAGKEGGGLLAALQFETLRLRTFGRSQRVLRQLVEDARQMAKERSKSTPRVIGLAGGHWSCGTEHHARALESVVLPEGQLERILARLTDFRNSREWYRQMGIPYRLGCLFHGVPGSGKTSLISALAGYYNCDLYVLALSGVTSDEKLLQLMDGVRAGSFILFEDIDAAVRGRTLTSESSTDKGITFSGLLNALDGVAAREGCVTFMTTNLIEELDPALIRPGRVDVKEEFKAADAEQIRRLFLRFYPEARPEVAGRFGEQMAGYGLAMCELQQHFLDHRGEPDLAVKSAIGLVSEDVLVESK